MFDFLTHLAQARKIANLDVCRRRIVIYSEGAENWPHIEPVVRQLMSRRAQFVYVSSSADDPGLALEADEVVTANIGSGALRTIYFATLEADIVLMSMPDLDNLHIRRSPRVQHYCYLHHSLVSHHMVYREHAFDHFDSVLCCGPHHVDEIAKICEVNDLPGIECIEHGYGKLDSLLTRVEEGVGETSRERENATILVAPSWGPEGLIECYGAEVILPLLKAGYEVIVRPHPQTFKLAPDKVAAIRQLQDLWPRLRFDPDMGDFQSYFEADLMISDWSGAALEYAFALSRPVLFVNVPRKVNNSNYGELGVCPIEVTLRDQIGEILELEDIAHIPEVAAHLMERASEWRDRILEIKQLTVFNIGKSGEIGADFIQSKLRQ